jgi:hypothetical protein
MKVSIIDSDRKQKICECGNTIFRKSARRKYTNADKTAGIYYELIICDKCGKREQFNESKFTIVSYDGLYKL